MILVEYVRRAPVWFLPLPQCPMRHDDGVLSAPCSRPWYAASLTISPRPLCDDFVLFHSTLFLSFILDLFICRLSAEQNILKFPLKGQNQSFKRIQNGKEALFPLQHEVSNYVYKDKRNVLNVYFFSNGFIVFFSQILSIISSLRLEEQCHSNQKNRLT